MTEVAEPSKLLSYADLARRWQAPPGDETTRRQWVRRRCVRLRLKPLEHFGRGEQARFRPADVDRAEAKAAGERRSA